MYTSESIAPRKTSLSKATPIIWYASSTISILLIYLVYLSYLQNGNVLLFFLGIFISLMLLIMFQESIVNKYVRMFPYWTLSLVLGIILGFLWTILMVGSLVYLVVQSGAFSTGLSPSLGRETSIIISIIAMPLTTAVVFVIFTYGLWHRVVKPIHKSEKLSEKHRILFAAIVAIVVSVFSALSIYVVLSIFFVNNIIVAFLISGFVFSYMTFSAFKEIYIENAFFGVFEIKEESQLLG